MATNILSPRNSSAADGSVLSSPQARRGRTAVASSPWTQIVRGADTEPVVSVGGGAETSAFVLDTFTSDWPSSKPPPAAAAISPPPPPDDDFVVAESGEASDNVNAAKKQQVWKKPSNGNGNTGAVPVEVSPVMDAASWPALSACTKSSPKSASSDSLKALSELPPTQGIGVTASLSSNKPVTANNANPNPTPSHVTTSRQRSMKRGSTNGVLTQPSTLPQSQAPSVEMTAGGKAGNNTGGESSSHKEGGGQKGGFSGDHQPQRTNSFNRRGGSGQHPRGDASYHHNHGGRRDQDRGNQDWNNPHRNFGTRDNHIQPQRVASRGFARGPHTTPAFIPPPPVPVRPFGNPMVYPEVPPSLIYVPGPPPESLRGVPIMAPAHPLYFPGVPDPQLHAKIVNQIDYYFSNENLIKDTFLRQNMDDQGWVPIKLIAGFKKVMHLTDNIQLILNAVQASTVVEVQNDKIRKRNEWMKWIMPPGPFSPVSSPQSFARSSHEMLTGQLQGIALDESFSRSSSGEFNSPFQQSIGEGAVQGGFERKAVAGSSSK